MAFDINAFEQAKVTQIEKKINVPELKQFFDKKDKPEWVIRSLTGHELALVNEACDSIGKAQAILEGVSSGQPDNIKEGIKNLIGKGSDYTPEDLIRRLKMIEFGSVPSCPEHICVKLAHAKPTTFYRLSNEIIKLTGDGADLGK